MVATASVVCCRATPGNKVSTLPPQSLRMLAHLSNKVEHWGPSLQGAVAAPMVLGAKHHVRNCRRSLLLMLMLAVRTLYTNSV